MVAFGKSDVGLKRTNNEDAYAYDAERGFCAVADGMGGSASGEVASQIFIETVREAISSQKNLSEQKALAVVQDTFRSANERILTMAKNVPEHRGMGCTAEFMVMSEQGYALGHVGDSRTYLFRDGTLTRITKDHSLVQDQIDKNIISTEEARNHSLRNVILRAVGIEETLKVDIIRGKHQPGDLFLLCSDGLTDMVEDLSIEETLSLEAGLPHKGERLVEAAKSAGGHDNITIIVCEILAS